MDLTNYDFIDFGSSKGGCIDFAKAHLGGKNGLGIDKDPRKVERLRELGYDCIEADITELNLPRECVRFVTMSHFLEHLPNLDAVYRTLKSAADAASDFLFIQGPYFDADEYLATHGLKFYWSDWHGHPCRLTSTQLASILDSLMLREYVVMARQPILDSDHSCIHPVSSPRNQHHYIPGTHPRKPFRTFERPLYKEMVCLVRLQPLSDWSVLVQAHGSVDCIGGTLPGTKGSSGGAQTEGGQTGDDRQKGWRVRHSVNCLLGLSKGLCLRFLNRVQTTRH